jgi:uncharacterized membrane protein YfcA
MIQMALLAVASFVAASINAIAGGGTFITFPTLTGGLGLNDKVANMTSTIGLWPGSLSSIYPALSEFKRLPKGMLLLYSALSLAGGYAGAILLKTTSVHSFQLVVPWLLLLATVIFAFSKPIARWAGRGHGREHRSPGWTLLVGVIQLAVAVYGGYFGAGIGVLMLAGLSFVGLDNINQMNALKVFLATLINGVASVVFLFSRQADARVDWKMAGIMAAVSVVGGFFGMAAARKLKQEYLRAVILLVGAGLTGFYFWKNYRG